MRFLPPSCEDGKRGWSSPHRQSRRHARDARNVQRRDERVREDLSGRQEVREARRPRTVLHDCEREQELEGELLPQEREDEREARDGGEAEQAPDDGVERSGQAPEEAGLVEGAEDEAPEDHDGDRREGEVLEPMPRLERDPSRVGTAEREELEEERRRLPGHEPVQGEARGEDDREGRPEDRERREGAEEEAHGAED